MNKISPLLIAAIAGALGTLTVVALVITALTLNNPQAKDAIAALISDAPTADAMPTVKPAMPKALPPIAQQLPRVPTNAPRYVSNAQAVTVPEGFAKVVIVIDDMGERPEVGAKMVTDLPKEITFSFLPYPTATTGLAFQAKSLGHEIMIHLPMEPKVRPDGTVINPGPHGLMINDDVLTLRENVVENLSFLKELAVGANNHMGSGFTSNETAMREVLTIVAAEKLFFMDSLTTADSKVKAAAKGLDLPILVRDTFLDHFLERAKVDEYLVKLEAKANKNGYAIAIGHPHQVTYDALQAWAPTLAAKKIALVPITAVLNQASNNGSKPAPEPLIHEGAEGIYY